MSLSLVSAYGQRRADDTSAAVANLFREQHEMVTWDQLCRLDLTRSDLRAQLNGGRWRRIYREVYATHTGPLTRSSEIWAALLACGPGAALSHKTAAELDGLVEPQLGGVVHVTVPVARRVVAEPGYRVHYLPRLTEARHPTRVPAQLRVEDTVLGLIDVAPSGHHAMAWATRLPAAPHHAGPPG